MLPNELHHIGNCSRRKRKETTGGVCHTTRQNIKLRQGQIQIWTLWVLNISKHETQPFQTSHVLSPWYPPLGVCISFTSGNNRESDMPTSPGDTTFTGYNNEDIFKCVLYNNISDHGCGKKLIQQRLCCCWEKLISSLVVVNCRFYRNLAQMESTYVWDVWMHYNSPVYHRQLLQTENFF